MSQDRIAPGTGVHSFLYDQYQSERNQVGRKHVSLQDVTKKMQKNIDRKMPSNRLHVIRDDLNRLIEASSQNFNNSEMKSREKFTIRSKMDWFAAVLVVLLICMLLYGLFCWMFCCEPKCYPSYMCHSKFPVKQRTQHKAYNLSSYKPRYNPITIAPPITMPNTNNVPNTIQINETKTDGKNIEDDELVLISDPSSQF